AALALARAERRLNLGWLVLAALLLDVVLWLLVLAGVERVSIPVDFPHTHQPQFLFPYSHGLLAALAWSLLAALATLLALRAPWRRTAALLIGLAVFSHWLLDALVHQPELPLAGAHSAKVGLGLWDDLPLALGFEGAITLAGLALFLAGAPLTRRRTWALALLTLLVLLLTIVGMTSAPAPPSARAMALASLVTLLILCALVATLARAPRIRSAG
ncbi:MAG: hypothetical protein JOZ67_06895, partial [Gammaproteobacteria bacterium]|nr:hypothetical protein [Gammaproteobacteria bacterium]